MNWDQWQHFSEAEFACKCGCGHAEVRPELLNALQAVRYRFNAPLPITSGYRCPKHNKAVGGHPTSAHMAGLAADIRVCGAALRRLLPLIGPQFTGIGLSQANRDWSKRFIHLDMAETGPRIWTYPS